MENPNVSMMARVHEIRLYPDQFINLYLVYNDIHIEVVSHKDGQVTITASQLLEVKTFAERYPNG